MLTLFAGQAGPLWDEALPIEVRELPGDLAGLDRLLADLGCWRGSWRIGGGGAGDAAGGVDGWAPDDRDGELCQVDGASFRLNCPGRVRDAAKSHPGDELSFPLDTIGTK